MVDGIVRNDVSNGWVRSVGFDFAFTDVERVEVIAGPGSSLYGANAYAGIVQVITRQPDANPVGFTLKSNFLLSDHATVAPEITAAYKKVNAGVNALLWDKLNANLRVNWKGKTKAPASNRYFYPKTAQSIAAVGYDYVTEPDPDGYLDGTAVVHLTLTGRNLVRGLDLEPQLIVRNLLGNEHANIGRQSVSGTRPVDGLQPTIRNPVGFIPAYQPQPGREIFFVARFGLAR